jgi:hypothetical protein
MQSLFVTNSTLYSLLQTVHLNQTQIIIPQGHENAVAIEHIDLGVAQLRIDLAALRADLDNKFAVLEAKLDQIIAQVTPPETGDTNPETAKIS